MTLGIRGFWAMTAFLAALSITATASAQKSGGILRLYNPESVASLSMLEEFANAELPIMGMFNNLVMFDQHVAQNSLQSIVPDLATSWSWDEEGTDLTFQLRQGVKWHDGKPFTAQDVKCTWDLYLETGPEKLRINPRKSSYYNLAEVTTNGDYEVTFHLKRPQPAFPMLLASGFSVIYPCHVSPRDMRQHPIGTGPFKLIDFKPKEYVKVARNPDYWKPGRPYLDGIEHTIIPDPATAVLAFIAGKFDMTAPYPADGTADEGRRRARVPQAICEWTPGDGQPAPARQPRQAAFRQRGSAARDGALDRPPGVHRHHRPRTRPDRRCAAAAARRLMGHAAGDAQRAAGLRPRRAEEPRRGAADHGGARLRSRSPAEYQGNLAGLVDLPGSGGAADRSTEAGLHRRRARTGRHRRNITRRSCARITALRSICRPAGPTPTRSSICFTAAARA